MVQALLTKGTGAVPSLKCFKSLLNFNKYAQYTVAQFSSKSNGLRIHGGVSIRNYVRTLF